MDELIHTAHAAVRMTAPLLYAAMGGLIAQHAGVINIGIEGMMLIGAFVGLVVAGFAGGPTLAVAAAALAGALLAVLFAWLVIRLKANVVVVGLGVNLFVLGGTAFIMQSYFGTRGSLAPANVNVLPTWSLGPAASIPVIGPILSGHTPVVYLSFAAVAVTWFILYRTRVGLWIRAAGEAPDAARAMGIPLDRVQLIALVLSGVLAAIGGVQLSIGDLARFNEGMTNGRGYIALAAYFFGQNRPGLSAVAAAIFGLFQGLQIRLQVYGFPPQLVQSIPYLMVVIALALIAYRKKAAQQRRKQRVVSERTRAPQGAGHAPGG